jgi:hypothetical protein
MLGLIDCLIRQGLVSPRFDMVSKILWAKIVICGSMGIDPGRYLK